MSKEIPTNHKRALKLLGKIIRQSRTSKNITLEQMAERCNTHKTSMQKIEMGQRNMTFSKLLDLCDGLECTLEDLGNALQEQKRMDREKVFSYGDK